MAHKIRYDIINENFDQYFINQISELREDQKDRIPKDIQFALFKTGGGINYTKALKLNFLQRIYVLTVARGADFIFGTIDPDNGFNRDEFLNWDRGARKDDAGELFAENLATHGSFFMSNKELMKTFQHMNTSSVSPAYNYISRIKNIPKNKIKERKIHMNYVASFIANYEGQKKKIIVQEEVNIPELYILFHLYDGVERVMSSIYLEKYRKSYNASRNQIQRAFVTLQMRGFVQKKGFKRGATLKITVAGSVFVDSVISKYFINF